MSVRPADPPLRHEFVTALAYRDLQTRTAYLTTLRDLVAWLATRPGGSPFRPDLLTVTAGHGALAGVSDQVAVPSRARSGGR